MTRLRRTPEETRLEIAIASALTAMEYAPDGVATAGLAKFAVDCGLTEEQVAAIVSDEYPANRGAVYRALQDNSEDAPKKKAPAKKKAAKKKS